MPGRTPRVALVPLSPAELRDFMERQVREYAEEKVRAGEWSREEAMELSRDTTMRFLEGGRPAPGHRFFKAVDEGQREVGWIWLGPPPADVRAERAEWLYQITVAESLRGRGFGRGMLRAAEDLLAREGVRELHLHVFRWNAAARSLYDSEGYEVTEGGRTDARMRKRLGAVRPGRRSGAGG